MAAVTKMGSGETTGCIPDGHRQLSLVASNPFAAAHADGRQVFPVLAFLLRGVKGLSFSSILINIFRIPIGKGGFL